MDSDAGSQAGLIYQAATGPSYGLGNGEGKSGDQVFLLERAQSIIWGTESGGVPTFRSVPGTRRSWRWTLISLRPGGTLRLPEGGGAAEFGTRLPV